MSNRLLVATIGGSAEPITASLLHWRPVRAIFVVSTETKAAVDAKIVPGVQQAGWSDFDAGRYDLLEVADAQDLTGIMTRLRGLDERIRGWLRDHPSSELIADFTGGTKAMTAGLTLTAARWPCQVSYVGGAERTKEGVGIVVSGKEQIVHARNPWDALGYLAVEQASVLFDHGDFSAATQLLEAAHNKMAGASLKREFQAFGALCQFCESWERFQHKEANEKVAALRARKNDLSALLGTHRAEAVMHWLTQAAAKLALLTSPPTDANARRSLVDDLIANASRRIHEGRYDDAVARIYRAMEAFAQASLHGRGFTDTGNVPLAQVPEPLRTEWQGLAENGSLKLGLQDDYKLLGALGDEAAKRFNDLELDHRQRSLLVARNNSILAHGYSPVSKHAAQKLLDAAFKLTNLADDKLLKFPKLQ